MEKSVTISKTAMLSGIVFLTQFVSFPYFSWYNFIRYTAVILVGAYAALNYKCLMKKKYIQVNFFSLFFSAILLWSSFQNRDLITTRNPFLAALVFVGLFLTFLMFMEVNIEKNRVRRVLNVFYGMAIIILLINDFLIIVFPDLYLSHSENYFVGTKFEVEYLHFLLICLYVTRIEESKIKAYHKIFIFGLLLWTFFIGLLVKCSTGMIGTIFLGILLILIRMKERIFLNAFFYAVVQALSFGFIFFWEYVLNHPVVKKLILNVLGKDITMSGRTNIYAKVPALLSSYGRWMTGFGYATSYELGIKLGGFPDTQNGILEWIWYAGIPAAVVMVMIFMGMLYISKKNMAEGNSLNLYSLLALLYVLTILGAVEITMSQMYFGICICVMGLGLSRSGKSKMEAGFTSLQ